MSQKFRVPRRAFVLFAVVAMTALSVVASASAAPAISQGTLPYVQGPDASGDSGSPSAVCIFVTVFGIPCYTPYQMGEAYNFPAGLDGAGQTIMIVDAYGNPNMLSNLKRFDQVNGVPDPGTPGGGSFTVVNGPSMTSSGSGLLDDWGIETSLDVEWAHAMAPNANIVLVRAASDDDINIAAALNYAIPLYPGAIVSQSFGEPEPFTPNVADYHAAYALGTSLGDTILASAGDWGASWVPILGAADQAILASYPASDPLVTGVGGTQGNPYPGGLLNGNTYGGESAWNEGAEGVADAATGGAPSILFATPPWQRSVTPYKTRSTPDVAYNAAILGGVPVVYTNQGGDGKRHTFLVGGTSAGSPQWASIFALVNQARGLQGKRSIGFANESLYKAGTQNKSAGAFHDITTGNNKLDSTLGFDATPGYDLTTGLGTPNVANLVQALVNAPAASNPDAGAPAAVQPGAATGRLNPHVMTPGG